MKNFNFNLLQYLNNKKAQKGFTLIELLVVIIIIGILSAIALPAFLNQAAKAKQSEAKQALGALNRGQQAYRLENNEFAQDVVKLALGVETDTKNYTYGGTGAFSSLGAGFAEGVEIEAVAKDVAAVRDYTGAVGATEDADGNATTNTAICEETAPADDDQTVSYTTTDGVGCSAGNKL